MNKIGKNVILYAVLPLAIAGGLFIGIREYLQYIQQEKVCLSEEIEKLKEQQEKCTQDAEAQQVKLTELKEEKVALEQQIVLYEGGEQAADPDIYLKQKMIDCYVENQELLVVAQAEVLESFGVDTSFLISYDGGIDLEGEAVDAVQSAIIGGLVNDTDAGGIGDIAGATLNETVNALRDEVTVESLYGGITKGLQNGIENTMQSSIQDKISEVVGFDVFNAANLLQKLSAHHNQIPTYLASQISDEMQYDAGYLSYALTTDTLTGDHLKQMQSYYYDLGTLAEELYNQTNGQVDVRLTDWEAHDDALREMNERYCINERIIEMCREQLGVDASGENAVPENTVDENTDTENTVEDATDGEALNEE